MLPVAEQRGVRWLPKPRSGRSKPQRIDTMLKKMLVACLTMSLLSGCVLIGRKTDGDLGCTWVKPIYLSRHDALTADTARQILVHNETGAERCNWKRVKK